QADARAAAATARVETLESALAAARARAGVERLADLHGVVGTLLDLVEVDEAFQSAFEAGAGEAIAAVVVEGVPAARTALERLHDDGIDGAVLALEGAQGPLTGGSSPLERPVLRAGTVGLREHVRGLRPEIDRLLDLLVGHVLVADTWEVAVDALAAGAGALIVTRDGGRFSTTGWRAATHGAGTTGGALREARDDADAAAREAAAHHAAADDAITATDSAREDARRAGAAADEASRRLATLHATTQRLDTDLGELRAELESLVAAESELQQSLRDDAERTRDLVGTLPGLEAEEARAVEVARRREEVRADLAARAVAVAARRSELDARSAHLHQRQAALGNRLGEIDARLDRDERLRRDAQERHSERTHAVAVLRSVDDVITARLSGLATIAGDLQEQRRRRMDEIRGETENLERLRADRATVETELTGRRARKEELALAATEARVRAEQVVETLRAELDADPEAALHADCPDLAEGVTPVARVRDLDRELRRMGTINPLAIAEFTERKERHEFLATQIDDVRGSRRELNKVIAEVDAQIAGTFAAAFADVRANFVDLFTMLFPGGSGDLALTDPGDPLNTGIEIAARPSGKNVRTLSLLSGGERSLVALAFLFAVFRSRSSPFYVMDEVEAALDDVNLHRFLDLVAEFRSTAQLIIVSHQKRTMEAADALFGVTMQPGGASKVVSKRS
ncbi:MAG: AAA family ATPase, partial [Actinobacteria bacterium]|nr:AAA family ATPase [Actinomycetota bacterium]